MIKIVLAFFILLFNMNVALADFTINIGLVHKKGGEKGTPLVSELYTSEEFFGDEIIVKMKDELTLRLRAIFSPEKDVYGPSQKVSIKGKVTSMSLMESKDIALEINLGEKSVQTFEFSDKRVVEVIIQAEI